MKKIILILILILIFPSFLLANVIRHDACDLGVRSVSLGNVQVALADDANTVFYNPAGLGFLSKPSLLSSIGRVFDMANRSLLSAVIPFDLGSVGLGINALASDSMLKADTLGNADGFFKYRETSYYLGYATKPIFELLSLGTSIKYITKDTESEQISAIGYDFSGLIKTTYFDLGLTFFDLGDTLLGVDKYQTSTRYGLKIKPWTNFFLACDYFLNNYYYGTQLNLSPELDFKVGYSNQHLTLGCGYKLSAIQINISFYQHELGNNYRFELGL